MEIQGRLNWMPEYTCDRYSLQLIVNISGTHVHLLDVPVNRIIFVLYKIYLDHENQKFMDFPPEL